MSTATGVKGVLVDLTKCIGCRGCQIACKQWNGRIARQTAFTGDFTNPSEMNSDTYTLIDFVENEKNGNPVWNFVKRQCMHCKEPACASACPVGAFKKSASGPVVYRPELCIGCRYCMVACPYGVPKYEWEKTLPIVQKCTFCSDRVAAGEKPLCVKTCPSGALAFGDYDEMMKEAKARLSSSPERYVNHIYGENEAGGSCWMYISDIPFDTLGFNTSVPVRPLPAYTWDSLSKIPASVVGLAVGLSAIAYWRNRGAGKEE